jgi:uncharacterized protein (DUF1501 family)
MDRRTFLACAGAVPFVRPGDARADAGRLLVVIDLLGGNDGLGTVMPWTDPLYYRLRPTIAPDRRTALPLDEVTALHPSLRALLPLWQAGELAVVQGVGCADAGLSHVRAREAMVSGPLDTMFSQPLPSAVERHDMCRRFGFPEGELSSALASACAALADDSAVSVVQATLSGFDTHEDQPAIHGALLAELAGSLAALREVLRALGRWDDTLVMTRSEFGRRAAENLTAGRITAAQACSLWRADEWPAGCMVRHRDSTRWMIAAACARLSMRERCTRVLPGIARVNRRVSRSHCPIGCSGSETALSRRVTSPE